MSRLRWDILGLSEVRRQGEDTITLKSGNLLFYREGDQQSQGGVGFLVHKSIVNNIITIESVSSRVAYLTLRISKRYSLKVVQVYAPTSSHPDDEVESIYEDISRAIHTHKTHFNVVMGDFNAKLGKRSDNELKLGNFGYGQRNLRGQRLANFLEKEGLFMMNSFFQKPPHRKWTWMSPNGSTRNEIDFIMTDKRRVFNDASVIYRVKTGSDHRIVEQDTIGAEMLGAHGEMIFLEGFPGRRGPPEQEEISVSQCVDVNNDDISTLHKRQTTDARQLCIFDINEKLTKYGEYDIGGTYTGNEADLWFYFTTSFGPGNKRLLNLFVCLRKEGTFNIGISNSNDVAQKPYDSSGRCYLLNQCKWQAFKSSQPNDKFFLKTFFFSLKQFEAHTLCIPILIKTSPISPFNMDLVKQIKVNHDFGDLLSKQEKTNFSVQSSSGKQYQVHKIILAAHSPILRNMVKSDTVSSLFLDINDNDMELLLQFLYTGSIKNILKQDCLNLLDIAGKFQLNNLFFLVQYAIAEQINVTNCMEMAVVSERYKLEDLQCTVFKFIKDHPGVFETDGWKNLDDVNLAKKMFQYLHTNNIKV